MDFNVEIKDQDRGVAPPLVAILFYRAIKEYAEKDARLLASHRLWQWLVPSTPAIQAAVDGSAYVRNLFRALAPHRRDN